MPAALIRRLLMVAVVGAFAACQPVASHAEDGVGDGATEGDSDSDHDLARDLAERGEIKPLREIIASLAVTYPGEILSVSLDQESGRWIYEFKILADDGTRLDIDVDAATMAVVDSESGE